MSFGGSIAERLTPSTARWDESMRKLARLLRVCLPGVIQSFDSTKMTVSVQPSLTEIVSVISAPGDAVWQNQTLQVPIPQLDDVPLVLPGDDEWVMTFPKIVGSECLVFFGDTCIDSWWESGGVNNNPIEDRRHDLSDGFAILRPFSKPQVISNYSESSVQIRNRDGSTVIDITSGQIELKSINVKVTASEKATIQGDTVDIIGNSGVNISQNTKIDNKEFLPHTHNGVQPGGGVSGPVTP